MIAGRSYVSPAVHTSPVQDGVPISDAVTQALHTKSRFRHVQHIVHCNS